MQNPISIYGIPIEAGGKEDCLSALREVMSSERDAPYLVFTPNLEMLSLAKQSKTIRALLREADLLLPDGIGVLFLSHFQVKQRIAGIDVGEALLSVCEKSGFRVYLLGSKSGVAARAKENLQRRFPALNVVGTHHGYFKEAEEQIVIKEIRSSAPDLLIVCTGFPRQEEFLVRNQAALSPVRVALGLGGSLDVWADDLTRAPPWTQKCGLEWLYRVLKEPKRARRILKSVGRILLPKK